jgi:RimJ/RimL family protein N-acetyltransferase
MTQATVHDVRPMVSARREPIPVRMSERYWGLHFAPSEYAGLTATPVPSHDCLPFITKNYAELFRTQPNRFFEEKMTEAKLRYLAECDVFLFRRDGVDVGVCVCNPIDWASYYVRTYALLPEVRGREFSVPFLRGVFRELRAVGVQRVEAETSPANIAVQRVLGALGMMITSTVNTDRWGLMLRLTGFLDEEADRAFRRQFLHVPGEPAGCPDVDRNKKGVRP